MRIATPHTSRRMSAACPNASCPSGAHTLAQLGFSLTEALVSLLLVGLMGTIIVAGIPAARNVYNSLVRRENAESVCTTLATRISTELRDATEFTKVGDEYVFVSHSGSALDTMRISITTPQSGDNAGLALVTFYSKKGTTLTAITSGDYEPELLLPEHSYVLGLKAQLTLTPNAEKNPTSVTIVVDVYYDNPDKPLSTQTLVVALGRGEGE